MLHSFSRTELLIGKEGMERLKSCKVAVFGIGGVGSYAVEALARSGVGHIVLVDYDDICLTNINRQIHATIRTVGRPKVDIMKERVLEINPKAEVENHRLLFNRDTSSQVLHRDLDYVIDAIDMVSSKLELIVRCKELGIRIISSMGAGNKLDPTKFRVGDIYETSICPLAKVMRRELRRRGIESLRVVYSTEKPIEPIQEGVSGCKEDCICPNKGITCASRRQIPGSIAFVPSVAGLILAGEVIKDITGYSS
ncbi:MAG: HesA/MoeB/ThiF family protein [Firmicutes bacterium]|nr:HesA/MoeB/ThiF family protein [Bacillota bacterium]MDI6706213.1 tRNA threonylcarbamoyladenosine dehydratase [Bacillota bacterium]